MPNRIAITLCDDCLTVEESDDYSSFDLVYTEREADARIEVCTAGLASLHARGDFHDDSDDGSEHWMRCVECCGIHRRADIDFVLDPDGDVEEDDEVSRCPTCGEFDSMSDRDNGRDEFSREECDSCGTTWGGSRTRYALFPRGTESEPVVPQQMEMSFD